MNTTTHFLSALFFLGVLGGLTACADVGDAPQATVEDVSPMANAAEPFTGTPVAIDTAQSAIRWRAAKVTGAHDGGFRTFDGVVYRDGGVLTGVDLTIDAASIWSDNEKLTGHLKSADFFDVEQFSEATFRADSFELIAVEDSVEWAEATHRIGGVLTMHGQAQRITFPAKVTVTDDAITATADFLIERSRWDLTYPGKPDDLIQEEVRLMFDVVAPGTMEPAASQGETASVSG
ncbi:MAG: YceI family protein [Rhodothermales bacterium]